MTIAARNSVVGGLSSFSIPSAFCSVSSSYHGANKSAGGDDGTSFLSDASAADVVYDRHYASSHDPSLPSFPPCTSTRQKSASKVEILHAFSQGNADHFLGRGNRDLPPSPFNHTSALNNSTTNGTWGTHRRGTYVNGASFSSPSPAAWPSWRGILMTILGVILLDFCCDCCQSPCRPAALSCSTSPHLKSIKKAFPRLLSWREWGEPSAISSVALTGAR